MTRCADRQQSWAKCKDSEASRGRYLVTLTCLGPPGPGSRMRAKGNNPVSLKNRFSFRPVNVVTRLIFVEKSPSDRDRCEFRTLLRDRGCIDLGGYGSSVTRSGVISVGTPPRVSVGLNSLKFDSMKEARVSKSSRISPGLVNSSRRSLRLAKTSGETLKCCTSQPTNTPSKLPSVFATKSETPCYAAR